MSYQTWQETLINATTDGAALGNTVTATSILPAQAKLTLPANYLNLVGQKLRLRAAGRVSNIVTTPGTLTFNVRFGSTTVATSGALTLNTTAKTNVTWLLEMTLDLRVSGSAAQFIYIGYWQSESAVSSAAGVANQISIPTSAPALGTAFDATTAQVVDLQAAWSIANAGNTITLHQYALESMN